jgi:CheY-like chemotaxis protein
MATILVIDDDESVRRLILRILKSTGHIVLEAQDGNEAIAMLKKHDADLIITDLVMPKKEGIATMREVHERSPGTKVIAISGGGTSRNMTFLDVARAMGADAALAKPFTSRDLLEVVERLLPAG